MNPLLKGAEQVRYYSPIYEPIYDEEDYVSAETPLYEEENDSDIDLAQALSDEELSKYDNEVYENLFGEEDAILSDALNHASIIDGVRLCKAKRYRYKNSDMADLEEKLKEAAQKDFNVLKASIDKLKDSAKDAYDKQSDICLFFRKYC